MRNRASSTTKKIIGGRRSRASLTVALIVLAAVVAWCTPSRAAPYGWTGGHDALGAPASVGTAYFAEGTTRNGFEEYLLLRNPGKDKAAVSIRYLFPRGRPLRRDMEIKPGAGASICVNEVVGPGKDVSVAIESSPGIIAERQVYFNYKCAWTGGTVSSGVTEPRYSWYFAEGTTRPGFQEWLCLQNPAGRDAEANITFMLATGETREMPLKLGANSRFTVDVNATLGAGQDVSVKVEATEPVVVERPMYFDYKGAWRGGHTSTGSADLACEWHFAEGTTRSGFEEWLSIMNPGGDTTAKVEYLFPGGGAVEREYALKAHSRTTVFVNEAAGPEKDVSVKVASDTDIMCERPMYFCYHGAWEGGHNVVGALEGARAWLFPTACSGENFSSWLCISNPQDTACDVLLEVLGEGGGYNSEEAEMPARSRVTFDAGALAASIENPWLKISGTNELIVERPVYFSYSPRVDPDAFTIATWENLEIKSPIRYSDCLGPQFHEASSGYGCPAMQPVGTCLLNDNPTRFAPGVGTDVGNDPYYFIESTRGRGTYATTACDIQAKAGTIVYAPVSGTVVAAEPYLLYGQYPDLRVKIRVDGRPDYQMVVLHMQQLLTAAGARVEAGRTQIGIVRDLVPYFNSGPNPYTRDDGNHAHIQINYAPAQASGAIPYEPTGTE